MKPRLGALTAAMVDKAIPVYGRSVNDVLDECETIIAAQIEADKKRDLETIGGTSNE